VPATSDGVVPPVHGTASFPATFATHEQLASYGFSFGPSDGQFGAIPRAGGTYTFYAAAGSAAACSRLPGTRVTGTFAFTGTLERVTGGDGCRRLFGPGDGPRGWVFDRNYAGGGQVVRFAGNGKRGWLMRFHAEYWWKNPALPDGKCEVTGGSGSRVDCFYSTLGFAVSLDDGASFKVVGQILEPSRPKLEFLSGGKNMAVGYGSLIVADANGKHLENPPADPSGAFFYLFYLDSAPGAQGFCRFAVCMGVARAPYADVVTAALSGDPHKVATVFRKYDGAWTQPATSDTPDLSGTAGSFVPLWTDAPGAAEVIYDRAINAYLAVYSTLVRVDVRVSSDLIHWSPPIGAAVTEPGQSLYYPTLIGETGDPTVGGAAPRIYFSRFPIGRFPDYRTAILETVQLALSVER
jgi:hypothetical protein